MEKLEIARSLRPALERYAKENGRGSQTICCRRLNGMCGIASFALQSLFKRYGYNSQVFQVKIPWLKNNSSHCYLVSGDEFFDLTATQFRQRPPIVYGRLPQGRLYIKNPLIIHDDFDGFSGWPEDQRPTIERIDRVLSYLAETTIE